MTDEDQYYAQFDIKRYSHWTLRIEEKQRYLGQAVVWLEREGDMQRLSSLDQLERDELWGSVLPEFEKALGSLWQPDHMNYAWLGNMFTMHNGHGHMHLIPRYSSARVFNGETFTDSRWEKNYVPYPTEGTTIEMAHAVRDALGREILGARAV